MAQSAKEKREKAERVQSQLGGHTPFDPKDHWCRDFDDMNGFANHIRRTVKSMSWGSHAWTAVSKQCLRFKVQGHHFTGHVWVVVSFLDLFDIFYTDSKGIVKFYDKDVYLEDFLNVVDQRVEYISEYGNK